MRSWANVVFWGLLAAVIGEVAWHYSELPSRVATHFDLSGRPNRWVSREAHALGELLLVLGLAAMLRGLGWLTARLPLEFINVPYRDFWFAPARRAASLRWLQEMLAWLGAGMVAALGAMFDQVYRANLRPQPALGARFWVVNAVLVAVIGATVVATLRRFHRPSPAERAA